MQKAQVFLKEIIWEITGKCENRCSYCGSKNQWDDVINIDSIKTILQRIYDYPPEELNISGGDPLLVPVYIHDEITKRMAEKKVTCKILINPKSFYNSNLEQLNERKKILSLYSWIGISINTKEELDHYMNYLLTFSNVTIITNFNLTNIFLFDTLLNLVKDKNFTWQIQYTMYPRMNDDRAIYNNEEAYTHLQNKINENIGSAKILLADNMNSSVCGAGLYNLGILANGDVVGCLSERSWKNVLDPVGNLVDSDTSLKFLWENSFKQYRFESFKCCKDYCKNKPMVISYLQDKVDIEKILISPGTDKTWVPYPQQPFNPPFQVTLYGVSPDRTIVYGVGIGGTVCDISVTDSVVITDTIKKNQE